MRFVAVVIILVFSLFIGGISVENITNSGWGIFIPFWIASLIGVILAEFAAPLSLLLWLLHFLPIHFPLFK